MAPSVTPLLDAPRFFALALRRRTVSARSGTLPVMDEPFLGTEALDAGGVTPYVLRTNYVALHQNVHIAKGVALTPALRARASWLRSRRRGILAGFSASALHGARWINPGWPATIIDTNRRPVAGVRVWEEGIVSDEIVMVDGMRITAPARTALDLARRIRVTFPWPPLTRSRRRSS